jgi:hypothetical protein
MKIAVNSIFVARVWLKLGVMSIMLARTGMNAACYLLPSVTTTPDQSG